MGVVLLDTTVAIFLHPRRRGSALRRRYEPHIKGQILALSFQSVAEPWAWAEDKNWRERERRRLEGFLRRFLIIPYDAGLAKVWARVSVLCRRQGRRLEAGDAWIAATAVDRQLTLLTHDRDHVGLDVPGLNVVSYVDVSEQTVM